MKKLMVLCTIGIFLMGCLGIRETKREEKRLVWEAELNTWIGQSVDELVDAVGYPSREIVAPNGNTVYVFEYTDIRSVPNISYKVGEKGKIDWGPTTYSTRQDQCTTYFEIDAERQIVNWRYEGDVYHLPYQEGQK